MEKHRVMGDKVLVYKRPGSPHWQCSTFMAGRNWRSTTKEESLAKAKDFAEDWFFTLKGKEKVGQLKAGKTFREVAEQFLREYQIITGGQRSPEWVAHVKLKLTKYLIPYFGHLIVSEITPGMAQEYRIWRMENGFRGKPPARKTIEDEMIPLRQVLQTAKRHRWLEYVPDFSAPFKASKKISHRAWFTKQQYIQLYHATREYTKTAKDSRARAAAMQLHDFVLFMGNTGLRPDEAKRVELQDVKIVHDQDSGETILEIEVRGKTGYGFCKSMPGAVRPFQRVRQRNNLQPTDRLFPISQDHLLNKILNKLNLKFDREGRRRSAYSLRHTYICLRLLDGADIYQLAKNCRTSVEMIQKHYSAHLKDMIDASAVNVRRPKPDRPTRPASVAVSA
jgi:integrase